jgi:transcriptional regulator with XRE-family HTH domain
MPPIDTPDPALAAAVLHQRKHRGETQEQLAHNSGLSVGSLARIERGEANPTWTTVKRIADGLEMRPSEFVAILEASDA